MAATIVFMGTPEVAAAALEDLLQHFSIRAVVTQPDRFKGRGLTLSPSPVKALAIQKGLEVLQPEKTKDPVFVSRLRELKPDLVVVVAYGGFLTGEIIQIPPLGCVNLHSSLLPKYRGATPVQWAVINGERQTGWTTFYIDRGMDSGDMILRCEVDIPPNEDAQTLFQRMIPIGVDLLRETVTQVLEGRAPRVKQGSEGVILAPRLNKEDGEIRWDENSAVIGNRIRGLLPWPGAYTFLEWRGKRLELKVFKGIAHKDEGTTPGKVIRIGGEGLLVGTGDGGVWLQEVQLEGARRMNVHDFLRGHPLPIGTRLG